ncbi:MAG: AsmA family protein [Thiotrichaceae bacterium]|nr:AsmA family protein [Thiotrichaceae bacterium]
MRVVKILGFTLLGIMGLGVIALIAVVLFVNPNQYKPQIISAVKAQTGRDLSLDGDLKLKLFPLLAVEMNKARLSNAQGFTAPDFASIESLQLRLKLLPLLRKEVEIDSLQLSGVKLFLAKDAKGNNNWADMSQPKTTAASSEPANNKPLTIALSALTLQDTLLQWDDASSNQHYKLSGLQLQAHDVALNKPITLNLQTQITSTGKAAWEYPLQLNTQLNLNLEQQQYQFNTLRLQTTVSNQALVFNSSSLALDLVKQDLKLNELDLEVAQAHLQGNVQVQQFLKQPSLSGQLRLADVDAAQFLPQAAKFNLKKINAGVQFSGDLQNLTFNDFKLQADAQNLTIPQAIFKSQAQTLSIPQAQFNALGVKAQLSNLAGQQLFSRPQLTGSLRAEPFDLAALLQQLGQNPLPKTLLLGITAQQAQLETQFQVNAESLLFNKVLIKVDKQQFQSDACVVYLKKPQLTLEKWNLQVADLDLKGTTTVENYPAQTSFKGTLQLGDTNLRTLLTRLGIALPASADNTVFTRLSLNTSINGNLQKLQFPALNLRLDQSSLQGALTIENFSNPAFNFSLAVDDLDVDRYLSPKSTAPKNPAQTASDQPFNLDGLRKLNLNGTLRAAKLKVSQLQLRDVALSVLAKQGDIKISPLSLNLKEGSLSAVIALNAQGNPPLLRIQPTLSHFPIAPVLENLVNFDRLSGVIDLNGDLNANFSSSQSVLNSLSGQFNVTLNDGAVKGANLAKSIRRARAVLHQQQLPPDENNTLQTDFSSLQGKFVAKNGVLYTDNLDLKSPLLRVSGVGEVNLVSQELAHKLQVGLVETSKGQEGLDLADLKGVVIPVNVHGPFKAPKVEPNLQVFLTNAAKQKLGELLHKPSSDSATQDKFKQKVGDLLNKQATTEKSASPTPQDKLWNDLVQPLKNVNLGVF